MKHTRQVANILIHVINVTICSKHGGSVELIGSLGKGAAESNNDIDVHIKCNKTPELLNDFMSLLSPSVFDITDWGGWYFHETPFGNVDVFFSTRDFDH